MVDQKRSRAAKAAHKLRRLLARERELWADGLLRVAGVDEVGVGPLAGPLVAAAVIFPVEVGLQGVDDSKKLTPLRREALEEAILEQALCSAVIAVEPEEIDRINIYQAGLVAMRRALLQLDPAPDWVLVDGRTEVPQLPYKQESLIGGDGCCHAIAAASILAKCERDRLMAEYDKSFPGYGFAAHKGYPTAKHREAIRQLGPTPIHRKSFNLLPERRLFD